jgi:hypothetical protein
VLINYMSRNAGAVRLQSEFTPNTDYSRFGAIEYKPKPV